MSTCRQGTIGGRCQVIQKSQPGIMGISVTKSHTETDQCITFVSCRRRDNKWVVAMNKWQTMTDMEVNQGE